MTDNEFPLNDSSFYANVFSYMGLPLSRDLDDEAVARLGEFPTR